MAIRSLTVEETARMLLWNRFQVGSNAAYRESFQVGFMGTMRMYQLFKRTIVTVTLVVLAIGLAGAQTPPATPATAVGVAQSNATGSQTNQQWPGDAANLRLHMIGNAHIDAPWLWPLAESNAVVHSTFRSALERLKEDPQVTMTTSSSQFYEWVTDGDPAMLQEIRKRVDEGRWDLKGDKREEPDVNIPNGESLIRQGLYGQR